MQEARFFKRKRLAGRKIAKGGIVGVGDASENGESCRFFSGARD